MSRDRAPRPVEFHVPFVDEREAEAVRVVLASKRLGGGGPVLDRVEARLRQRLGAKHAIATTSCTHAFEIATMIRALGPADEVILPSYSHPGVASAVVRTGAHPVFADTFPDNPQVDPADVERRVTTRTRALILVHYGGVPSPGTDALASLCEERQLMLLEDAAQAFDARYRGRACGTLGAAGCISFHETKNITCGEGGVLLTDDDDLATRAEVVRETGTDRAAFRAGCVDRYTWQEPGSTYLPAELAMAVLEVQLEKADEILARRRRLFDRYLELLGELADAERLMLPSVPAGAEPNGHIFHVLTRDEGTRDDLAAELARRAIGCARHFEPLDDSRFGRQLGADAPPLPNTRRIARTLLRLPLHPYLTDDDQDRVVAVVRDFVKS